MGILFRLTTLRFSVHMLIVYKRYIQQVGFSLFF